MNGFRKTILTLAGLVIFIHSISLYAVPVPDIEISVDTEMTEEHSNEALVIHAFDAVVPAIQYVHPFGWIYLGEVVIDHEPEFKDYAPEGYSHHGYLEVLFPKIISPNAP